MVKMTAVVLALGMVWGGGVWAQTIAGGGRMGESATTTAAITVRGRVVNAVTREPVARALVDVGGRVGAGAVLTNDRGEFELRIQGQTGSVPGTGFAARGNFENWISRVDASKPGFFPNSVVLQPANNGIAGNSENVGLDVTIAIKPEALIVGHVEVPGSEGEVRIQCGLYMKVFEWGVPQWVEAGTFQTWNDGEFRFSDLQPGTYKLITHEQMERDAQLQIPGMRMYGFPPMYYPNTTDFSAASEIKVKAGETAQVNLRVEKREYFPVRMPLRNMPTGIGVPKVRVTPVGSHGPGWSLGYMPGEGAIGGLMPDGNFEVTVEVGGENSMSGSAILSVKGRPAEGPAMVLVPNANVTVNFHEESSSSNAQDPNEGQVTLKDENQTRLMVRAPSAGVNLMPADELNRGRDIGSRPGTATGTQVLEGVPPGRYYVRIYAGASYVAAAQSEGTDLLHQPLVVGIGGSVAPIEVTLRNDGGEVSGKVVDNTGGAGKTTGGTMNWSLFLMPEDGALSSLRIGTSLDDGTFKIEQVPPGNYVLVAKRPGEPTGEMFEGSDYTPGSGLQDLEGKGQKVHVEARGKVNVTIAAESE